MLEIGVRALIVALALAGWFWSQRLLAERVATARIRDGVHELTAPLHEWMTAHPRATDWTLIISSLLLDLIGVYLIATSIFGPTFRPFIALFALFALRQISQMLCALPAPPGAIWRHPGFPSLLVTYDTDHDYFFSGHTAIAVLGAIEMVHAGPPWLGGTACVVAALEAATVLVLRAHYTMDILAAFLAAYFSFGVGAMLAPTIDRWIVGVF